MENIPKFYKIYKKYKIMSKIFTKIENLHKFIKKYTKFQKNNKNGPTICKNLRKKKKKIEQKIKKKN
jgi:hypothetical protein